MLVLVVLVAVAVEEKLLRAMVLVAMALVLEEGTRRRRRVVAWSKMVDMVGLMTAAADGTNEECMMQMWVSPAEKVVDGCCLGPKPKATTGVLALACGLGLASPV